MANSLNRVRGSVKWFDVKKGFGFVTTAESKQDIFIHHSEIEGKGSAENPKSLDEGAEVEFEIGQGKKGPCAKQLKLVKKIDLSK